MDIEQNLNELNEKIFALAFLISDFFIYINNNEDHELDDLHHFVRLKKYIKDLNIC